MEGLLHGEQHQRGAQGACFGERVDVEDNLHVCSNCALVLESVVKSKRESAQNVATPYGVSRAIVQLLAY